jgi:hypothetical protein
VADVLALATPHDAVYRAQRTIREALARHT